jgi:hypothetical protein
MGVVASVLHVLPRWLYDALFRAPRKPRRPGTHDVDRRGGQVHDAASGDVRIASLVPSITELLFDLGLADRMWRAPASASIRSRRCAPWPRSAAPRT